MSVPKHSRKRKISKSLEHDTSKEDSPTKKAHTDEKKFDSATFKFMLKDSSTVFLALEKFTKEAQKPGDGSDIVYDFIQTSPECSEILLLLKGRKPPELKQIFECLECILLRTAGDLKKHHSVGKHIVTTMLSAQHGHVAIIQYMLHKTHKAPHLQACLRLLVGMVMQGEGSARDVWLQINLTKSEVVSLLQRRNIKSPHDVRTCFLQLIMGLLLSGSDQVIKKVVESKGFLNMVFSGLAEDKLATIQMVLPTCLDKIVKNPELNKTSKIRVFSERTLKDLVRLYSWKGPKRFKDARKQDDNAQTSSSDVAQEEKVLVMNMVHEFLQELCCPFNHGINFLDKSCGTTDRNMNHVLTTLLCSLNKPYTNSHMPRLVCDVLLACPDQLTWYLRKQKHLFVPRPTQNWLECMGFLKQIYKTQPDVSPALKMKQNVSMTKLVDVVLATLVPVKEVWTSIIAALKDKEMVVRHEGLFMLHMVLHRAAASLHYLATQCDHYSNTDKQLFVKHFTDKFSKMVPELTVISQCWKIATRSNTVASQPEQESETANKEAQDKADEDLASIDIGEHIEIILTVLESYQTVLSEYSAQQTSLDFAQLLEGVQVVQDPKVLPGLQLQVLKLLTTENSHKVPWFKESMGGKSTLYLLLELTVSMATDDKLGDTALQCVAKMLKMTGLFESSNEVEIWLKHLPTIQNSDPVLKLLETCLSSLIKDPCRFMDELSKLVNQASSTPQQQQQSSAMDLSIAEILNMDDVDINDESITESSTVTVASNQSRFPFSQLCVAVVSEFEKVDQSESEVISHYIDGVFRELLRNLDDPTPLCCLVARATSVAMELPDTLTRCHVWMPAKLHKTVGKPKPMKIHEADLTEKDARFGDLLENYMLAPSTVQTSESVQHKLLDQAGKVSVSEAASVCKQLLLYYSTSTRLQKQDVGGLTIYLACLKKVIISLGTQTSTACDDTMVDTRTAHVSTNNALSEVIKLILDCPSIQEHFLCTEDENSSTTDRSSRSMSSVTTEIISTIAESLPKETLSQHADFYTSKIEKQLAKMLAKQGNKNLPRDDQVFVAFKGFLPAMSCGAIMKVLEIMCDLPEKKLVKSSEHKYSPSQCGELLILSLEHLTNEVTSVSNLDKRHLFSLSCLSKILNIASQLELSGLDKLLLDLLKAVPVYCVAVTAECFEKLLKSGTSVKIDLAAVLVKHSPVVRQYFAANMLAKPKWQKKAEKDQFLPVMANYVAACGTDATLKLVELYWDVVSGWIDQFDEEPKLAEMKRDVLLKLVTVQPDSAKLESLCKKLCESLQDATHKVTVYKVDVYWSVTTRLDDELYDQSCVTTCLTALANVLSSKKHDINVCNKHDINVCNKLVNTTLEAVNKIKNVDDLKVEFSEWKKFVKHGLRNLFGEVCFLELVCQLEKLVSLNKQTTPSLYEMVLSHSSFMPTVIEGKDASLKDGVVSLLLCIAERDLAVCQSSHVPVLFSAYGATLTKTDQKLLKLLQVYEDSGCDLTQFRPYFFGPKALEQYSVRKSLGTSLWKQPSMENILESLDPEKLHQSWLNYPLRRQLKGDDIKEASHFKSLPECYDPSFILPFFSSLLALDRLVNCQVFIEYHCLGYVLTALSSHHKAVRLLASYTLVLFSQHLEGARSPERDQVIYLLDMVKQTLPEPGAKLKPIISIFLAKAAIILLNPVDHLYSVVNSYLYLKPVMSTNIVPDFYKLFNSNAMEYKLERSWLLTLMCHGLREKADFDIYQHLFATKLLMTFHDSPISDAHTQKQVLRVIERAVCIRGVAVQLVNSHGLLAWLVSVVRNSTLSDKLDVVMDIVAELWRNLMSVQTSTGASVNANLPPSIVAEVLGLLTSIIHATRSCQNVKPYHTLVTCLASVLDSSQDGLNASTMTLLLYQWSRITRDHSTVADLQAIMGQLGETQAEIAETASKDEKQENDEANNTEDNLKMREECMESLISIMCSTKRSEPATTCDGYSSALAIAILYQLRWALLAVSTRFSAREDLWIKLVSWLSEGIKSSENMKKLLCKENKLCESITAIFLDGFGYLQNCDTKIKCKLCDIFVALVHQRLSSPNLPSQIDKKRTDEVLNSVETLSVDNPELSQSLVEVFVKEFWLQTN